MKTLYISYYGALKPLCQTQVIPYLRELAREGIGVTLLTFEEKLSNTEDEKRQKAGMKKKLAEAGLEWHYLRYHKSPSLPATMFDVLVGICYVSYLVVSRRIDVVHARSHIPAVIALVMKRLFGVKFLFDMRGLMAEEYVNAGTWKKDCIPFKLIKWVEAKFFRNADAIVMLTHRVKKTLLELSPALQANSAPIVVIPCCFDFKRFRIQALENAPALAKELGIQARVVMVYLGQLGGRYLSKEMVDFFAVAREIIPTLYFLVITQSEHELIRSEFVRRGIESEHYCVMTLAAAQVPEYLAIAHFGISFVKPCFAHIAMSPTKLGEYLISGLPVIMSAGIGDVDEIVTKEEVGIIVHDFGVTGYKEAAIKMGDLLNTAEIRHRCHVVAEKYFSLEKVGKKQYLKVYQMLDVNELKEN